MSETREMMRRYDVITTVYNDERNIIELLKEMEAQTLLPNQIIITDGGSGDATVAVIKRFAENSRLSIIVYEGERLNIAQGFNKGIKNSRSEYIGIVACGNHYPSNYFECLVKVLDNNQVAQVAFASVRGDGKTEFSKAYERTFMDFYKVFPSNHGNLVRSSLYKRYGCFCEEFSYAGEDVEFFGRISAKGEINCYVPNTYCIWEVPDDFESYIKQTKNYIIGNMELFSNRALLHFYKKKIIYCMVLFCGAVFLLIPIRMVRFIGCLDILVLIGFNSWLYLKKGKYCYIIKQIEYTYWSFVFVKNLKLFLKKHKISHPLNIDIKSIGKGK